MGIAIEEGIDLCDCPLGIDEEAHALWKIDAVCAIGADHHGTRIGK